MDLKEAWKKLEQEKLNRPILGAAEVHKASKHPVGKLILLSKMTLGFAVFFEIGFIYFIFHIFIFQFFEYRDFF